VQRPAKFAKYLSRMGWRVTVLTTRRELYWVTFGLKDPSLLEEIPPEVEVLRIDVPSGRAEPPRRLGIPGLDLLRYRAWLFFVGPDHSYMWSKRAARAAVRRGKVERFDLVMATGGPFSSLMAGRRIAGRLRVPFVADFRDPWCQRDWPPGWRAGPRARRWERSVMSGAARAVFATEGMRRIYAEAYPGVASRFVTVENGVDLEEPWRSEPASVSRERFEMVYTGQFPHYRSPACFLRALRLTAKRSEAFASCARFLVAGGMGHPEEVAEENRATVARLGLSEVVEERGYLPHAGAVRLQRSAAILVAIVGTGRSSACGKSYEYLAAGRPILALAPPDGEAARVLGHSPLTVFADRDDPEDIAAKLLELFARWESGELFELPRVEVPERYTRAFQAERMSEVLGAALAEGPC